MKKYIIPKKDYRVLDWVRDAQRSGKRYVTIEWLQQVLFNDGRTEIEVGQFINQYVTKCILLKLGNGKIKVNCGLNAVKFDYDRAEV